MYIPKRTDDDAALSARLRDNDEDFEGIEDKDADEAPDFLKMASVVTKMDQASKNYTERAKKLVTQLVTQSNPNVIDRVHLIEVAGLQRERFFGCLSLPFSFAFFLFFALSAFLHEDITNVYFIESGLRDNIGGAIGDVDSIAGTWSWIKSDLIPTVFNQDDSYGDPEPNKKYWNRVLMFNQLSGPLVIEQTRSKKELCFDGATIFGDMRCYPSGTNDDETIKHGYIHIDPPKLGEYKGGNITLQQRRESWESSFSIAVKKDSTKPSTTPKSRRLFLDAEGNRIPLARRLRIMRTEYMTRLPGGTAIGGGSSNRYLAYFFPNTPKAIIQKHVDYLEKGHWIDEQTKQVKIKAMLLNSEVGRPRLEMFQILFRFSRAGGVFARMSLESLFLKMWSGAMSMGADALFFLFLVIVSIFEILAFRAAFNGQYATSHMKKPWTILEMLILFFGWLTLAGYAYQNSLTGLVKKDLKAVVQASTDDIPAETNAEGEVLTKSVDSLVNFNSYFRILQAEYHLVLLFRFFSAFYAQPRLGVVTNTLVSCVVDVIHFLIVLLPTFMAYAISACFIFGRRMVEYSTFNSSIGLCFKMIMEGEFDWDNLSSEHYWTAALWTWTFMLLLVLLMMNMVLAIVMDIYTEKRKAAGAAETVGVTIWNLITRFRNGRVWVSNKDLLEKGATLERLCTRDDMLKIFPGICDAQLDALMDNVKYQGELETLLGIDMNDSMKMTMAIKLGIDKINADIHALQDGDHSLLSEDRKLVHKEWLSGLSDQMAASNHWMLGIQWQMQQLQWQWQALQVCHGQDVHFGAGGAPSSSPADFVL